MATSFKPTVKVTRLRDPVRLAQAKDKIAGNRTAAPQQRRSGRRYDSTPTSPVIIDLAHEREIRKSRHEEHARRPDRNWIQAALIMLLIAIVVLWTWL
jgi:hypothetical protein